MRAHVIKDDKIVNTIEVESLDVLPGWHLVDAAIGGAIGDTWADGAPVPAAPPAPVIPEGVTRRQGLLALLEEGITESMVIAKLEQLKSGDDLERARIDFIAASTFERFNSLVLEMGVVFNLDLDALFTRAKAIV